MNLDKVGSDLDQVGHVLGKSEHIESNPSPIARKSKGPLPSGLYFTSGRSAEADGGRTRRDFVLVPDRQVEDARVRLRRVRKPPRRRVGEEKARSSKVLPRRTGKNCWIALN